MRLTAAVNQTRLSNSTHRVWGTSHRLHGNTNSGPRNQILPLAGETRANYTWFTLFSADWDAAVKQLKTSGIRLP